MNRSKPCLCSGDNCKLKSDFNEKYKYTLNIDEIHPCLDCYYKASKSLNEETKRSTQFNTFSKITTVLLLTMLGMILFGVLIYYARL